MKIIDKFTHEATDRFIDEKYKGLLQLCLLYAKFDRKNLLKSCLQYFLYVGLVMYHWIFAIEGLILTKGINFILYSKGAYYLLVIQMTLLLMISVIINRDAIVRFHRAMSNGFYDYQEEESEDINRMREERNKLVRRFSLVPISTVIGAVFGFVFSPLLDKYGTYVVKDISHHLNINLLVPIVAYQFSTHTQIGFVSEYLSQVIAGNVVIFLTGGGGYVYIAMIQTLRYQLKILMHSIERYYRDILVVYR